MKEPNNERKRRKLTLYDYVTYTCALLLILFILSNVLHKSGWIKTKTRRLLQAERRPPISQGVDHE